MEAVSLILAMVTIIILIIIIKIKDNADLKKNCTISTYGKVTNVWFQKELVRRFLHGMFPLFTVDPHTGKLYFWSRYINKNIEYFSIEYEYEGKKYNPVYSVELRIIKKGEEYPILINPENPEEIYIPKGAIRDYSKAAWLIPLIFITTYILLNILVIILFDL